MTTPWWKGIGFLLFVALVTWIGYSTWVMQLHEFSGDTRAVLQVADRVAPETSSAVRVAVTDRNTDRPRADQPVTLEFTPNISGEPVAGVTDEAGVFTARFEAPDGVDEVEVTARIDSGRATQTPSAKFRVERGYSLVLDTDKPRYQPGQDIQIRAIARHTGGTPVVDDVTIQVENPAGIVFFKREISPNEFGMLQTTFPLADVAPEGRYRLVASYGNAEQVKTVDVERYTLPQFQVHVDSPRDHYRPGDTVHIALHAEYFFGKPVAHGDFEVVGAGYVGAMDQFQHTTGQLDDQGRATLTVELPDYFVGAPDLDGLGLATIDVEVTDGAGDRESTLHELVVSEQDILIDVFPAGGALIEGVENRVWLTTRTPRRPVSATVELDIEGHDEPIHLKTNANGLGSFQATPQSQSATKLLATATATAQPPTAPDDDGSATELRATQTLTFGAEDIDDLVIIADRPSARIGDTLAIDILSRRKSGPLYLDVISGAQTHLTKTLSLQSHRASLDLDISPAMRNQVEIRAWAMGSGGAVHKTATLIPVNDAHDLSLRLAPNAADYRPGESAQIHVETTEDGQPVAASVGLDIVDESVFAAGSRRSGLAAAHFQIDESLLQPTAWLYDVGPDRLLDPRRNDADPMPHCGFAYAHLNSATTHSDGWLDLFDSIQQRQADQAQINGVIALFFLIVIPLAMIAWLYVHRRRNRQPGRWIGITALVTLAIAALSGVVMVSFMATQATDGIEIAIYLFIAGTGGSLLANSLASRQPTQRRLWRGLTILFTGHMVILLGAFLWFPNAFVSTPLIWGISLFTATMLLAGLAIAFLAADWFIDERYGLAIAPTLTGVLYLSTASLAAVEQGWFFSVPYLLLALGLLIWVSYHRNRDVDLSQRFKIATTGLLATMPIAIVGVVLVALIVDLSGEFLTLSLVLVAMLGAIFASGYVATTAHDDRSAYGLSIATALMVASLGLNYILFPDVPPQDGVLAIAVVSFFAVLIYLGGKYVMRKNFFVGIGFLCGTSVLILPIIFSPLYFYSSQHAQLELTDDGVDRFAVQRPTESQPASDEDEAIRVRQFFPETLFSDIIVTDDEGKALVELDMADSITNWKLDAIAASGTGSLGTASADAIVFQPFFVEPQLPTTLTQGDQIVVPLSIYNYGDEPLAIEVVLEDDKWVEAEPRQHRIQLAPNQVDRVEFHLTAVDNGTHPLQWTARATGTESGEMVGDAVRRSVTVEPHGRQQIDVVSGQLDGPVHHTITVPSQAVAGSEMAVLELHPGLLGQIIDGMDAMLQMPTGCFEQTSSALYPNAMALAYLERTGTINPEIHQLAMRYIATGYQRILGFEVSNGGYSLFGQAPASHSITAYGLRMLGDIDEVYTVDPDVQRAMYHFVVNAQNRDGSWDPERDADYVVGIDDSLGLTAFIAWSLATYEPTSPAVLRAIEHLKEELEIADARSRDLALMLQLFTAADIDPVGQREIAAELATRAEEHSDVVQWSPPTDSDSKHLDVDSVETTAQVTSALLASDQHHALAGRGLAFLVESKSTYGWGTTQATVAALSALTSAATAEPPLQEGQIIATRDGDEVWSLPLNEHTSHEAHLAHFPLPSGASEIQIVAPDSSGYNYRLETRYHEPWEETAVEDHDLGLIVNYDRTEVSVEDRVEVTATLTVDDQSIGMAMADIGIPPGFVADRSSLDQAVERGSISDYEISERQVTLYIEGLRDRLEASFSIVAHQPIQAGSGTSSAYDYYDPARHSRQGPVHFVVRH